MKITNLKKIIIITFLLFTVATRTEKTHAGVADWLQLALGIAEKVRNTISDVSAGVSMAQTVANTYKSGKALAQNVKNFDLSTFAQNIGSDQILNYAQTALAVATGDQGIGININTKGNQVITNLQNYIDKTGVNEIKKAINDFKEPQNTSIYSAEIKKQITDFTKNVADTAAGKLITFTLPYIARNEICNDPKLKNIIKNGEPIEFTKPKPAVANVDIDKLCDSSAVSIMSAEDQATFVGLAKAGYGGEKTENALRDPANSANGVITNTLSRILSKKEAAEEAASKQAEATGLTIGQQVCFDKNGKKVDFDPAASSSLERACYGQDSTPEQSGAMVQDRNAAALLGPYFSMLARAQAVNNKVKECQNGGGGSGSDFQDTANKFNSCVSIASDIMNTISGVLNIGAQNTAMILNQEDNPYSRLANNLRGIVASQNAQAGLYADANQAQKDYNTEIEKYTIDDLKDRISLYNNIRYLNTIKLNEEVFTYTFLVLSIGGGNNSIDVTKQAANSAQGNTIILSIINPIGNLFGGGKKAKKAAQVANNTQQAVVGLSEALINVSKDIRQLIKDMAKNNYDQQQMEKLLKEFQNTDSRTEDNQEALATVLDKKLTQKDFSNMQLQWDYVPKYQDDNSDPTASTGDATADSRLLIPTKDEREGPYTSQNIFYLRIRAWNTYKKGANRSFTLSKLFGKKSENTQSSTLLAKYAMSKQEDINPNLPILGTKGVTNVLDSDNIKDWYELKFCNTLGLENTVCDDDVMTSLLNNYAQQLSTQLPSESEMNAYCVDVVASVEKDCQLTTDPSLMSQCQNSTQKQDLINAGRDFCSPEE